MDCLRNFTLSVSQSRTFNIPTVDINSWGIPNTNTFVFNLPALSTVLSLNSSRALEIYGVKLNGDILSSLGINKGILEDFGFQIALGGLVPTISGAFVTNAYAASLNPASYRVTKYNPELKFEQPISGCKSVSLIRLFGSGRNLETLNIFTCDIELSVTFYYKFEGE